MTPTRRHESARGGDEIILNILDLDVEVAEAAASGDDPQAGAVAALEDRALLQVPDFDVFALRGHEERVFRRGAQRSGPAASHILYTEVDDDISEP